MAAERCPLCQSKLKNGECESCGYRLPDEGGISAYYNYDPSDYPQEQPAVREITPEHQMEEIYLNRPEPIDFKVRNDEGKTVKSPYNQNNQQYGQAGQNYGQYRQTGQYGGQNQQQNYYGNNMPYVQYKQTGQYGGQNNGQQPYNQPYYRNNGQYNYPQNGQYPQQKGQFAGYYNNKPYYQNYGGNQQYNGSNSQSTGDLKEFLAKYWWILLIAFFFPFFGAILYAILVRTNLVNIDHKYRKLIIAAIVLGFILPPFT